jgi:hypothetical protein
MPRKNPITLTLDPKIQKIGKKLAEMDRRSLSNYLEVLILKEWQKKAKKPNRRD